MSAEVPNHSAICSRSSSNGIARIKVQPTCPSAPSTRYSTSTPDLAAVACASACANRARSSGCTIACQSGVADTASLSTPSPTNWRKSRQWALAEKIDCDDARTSASRRRSLFCSASLASRSAVRSRNTLTNPIASPVSSRNTISEPLAQNRSPDLRTCQRSSMPLPLSSAAAASISICRCSTSSGVKVRCSVSPSISASLQPRMRRAPSFHDVTRPCISVAMMA